jgi:hypothetical protein
LRQKEKVGMVLDVAKNEGIIENLISTLDI